MSSSMFSNIPEEILERILGFCFDTQPESISHPTNTLSPPVRGVTGIMLVNKTFLRVATPLFYRTLFIQGDAQIGKLLDGVFLAQPLLGLHAKNIIITSSCFERLDELAGLCPNLESFDMVLDNKPWSVAAHESFRSGLPMLSNLKHLVIRKDAYLTQDKPKQLLSELTEALPEWSSLETVHMPFRMGSDQATSAFADALSVAPSLHTFRTVMPSIWSPAILNISQNPSLQRIHLAAKNEIVGSTLFLSQARKHERLMELIEAGTRISDSKNVTVYAAPRQPLPASYSMVACIKPEFVQVPVSTAAIVS